MGYLRPHEEYQAAVVCRDWHAIVHRRREQRGEKVWRTWIGVFCNSIARLVWARLDGCPWSDNLCRAAAGGGHLEVLKYLRENGCRWDERTCHAAARGGHLEVLKYLHERGCPWDEMTCWHAAWGGHLEMLKYARANGCPWDRANCLYVSKGEVRDWIEQQG